VKAHLVVVCAAAGASVGAVVPWLVYRLAVPSGASPRTCCVHCDAELPRGWRGWIRCTRRCPACREGLTAGRPGYVAATATAFGTLAWQLPTRSSADAALFAAWLLTTGAGVLLAGIDLHVWRLPTPIITGTAVAVAVLVAIAAAADRDPAMLVRAAVGGTTTGGVYLAVALVTAGQLGAGDVRLAAMLGGLLGTAGPTTAIAGAVLPYLIALPVTLVLLGLGRISRNSELAFGPYVLTGAVLARLLACP